MFTKVLIANRGAIACRIIRTLKKLNIQSVAVYAESDVDSLHVQLADASYSLGEGGATETYLNQDKLFEIIKTCGAEAVHPGYGFLSENDSFVQRCENENIVFIGPKTKHILAFAQKHQARKLAENASVPLIPGSDLLSGLDEALSLADQIGYPVILKSTAGGGGIGMQVCTDKNELSSSYESVVRLSENNFSNSGVFLEKYIEQARHIEVQAFGDGKGKVVALGERDCSLQRRNQKVIEETPAPDISDDTRNALRETATSLLSSVQYENAGTVEFIYDTKSKVFYFLEVNTRLQVEHGVTEQVYGVDLVEWMLLQAAGELPDLNERARDLRPKGHAIQARIYAENPAKNFQPSAGLLSYVEFPEQDGEFLRIDHWLESGIEISPNFDPMLAKIIVHARNRTAAIKTLSKALGDTQIYGIETNLDYCQQILASDFFAKAKIHTRLLNNFSYTASSIDVLSGGTMTTIQDLPGRCGYWDVGVPPSGPFDRYSFALGNRLLGNAEGAAGLEITLNGPSLKFNINTQIVLTGANIEAALDGQAISLYTIINIRAGQTLTLGKVIGSGARTYLLVRGGLVCPEYLGSRSTFTLGQFGGHSGRTLGTGDVLHFDLCPAVKSQSPPDQIKTKLQQHWELRAIYGPHGAPDFFTDNDIEEFFNARWEVHYNSSRTGIRLIGPKPEWARSDGGEAGMHPSNLHDNAYAFGAVDFTGDMPVILGPDGPSLGGFVCPATVINADLWKLGQLKAGDTLSFIAVSHADALRIDHAQQLKLQNLKEYTVEIDPIKDKRCIIDSFTDLADLDWVIRPAGDRFLLVELGEHKLDLSLRLRIHCLMLWLQQQKRQGILELTPGIRSLQIHYDPVVLPRQLLVELLHKAATYLTDIDKLEVPSRIVYLPLSWDDEACKLAVEKYMQSVRKDAPWCPSNIEFIRRINGLESVEEVKDIVFNASYVVMGLGDVYLGAPVAVPIDPRHRLVTTKYNPARTWTAENSVGIGGSYLCIYGMEGPGGYQFIGRTLQMWNRYRKTDAFEQPWLLRFFDQIRFYPVSAEELKQIRQDFPRGRYPIKVERTRFSLAEYIAMLARDADDINAITKKRKIAFNKELDHWRSSGQFHYAIDNSSAEENKIEHELPENCQSVDSSIAGNVWQVLVEEGEQVTAGQALLVLESMKMEIEVVAPTAGTVITIYRKKGDGVTTGQSLLIMESK